MIILFVIYFMYLFICLIMFSVLYLSDGDYCFDECEKKKQGVAKKHDFMIMQRWRNEWLK